MKRFQMVTMAQERDEPPTCSDHLSPDAESNCGSMDGNRQEKLPHAGVGLLKA